MLIKKQHHRARVVKGWAFTNLTEEEKIAVIKFMDTGNTDDLPERYKREDYSIYLTGR